jgi:hypothetical protein
MATAGFEFAYMLDGSNATPLIRDLPVHGTGAYASGDLVLIASDGQVAKVTNTTTEVSGVMQETRAASVGADGDSMKVAIITRNQVWRCSMDASTCATVIVGYTKTLDTADCNTIDADDVTNGSMILVDKSTTDDDGNVLAYVVFADTTFGNT